MRAEFGGAGRLQVGLQFAAAQAHSVPPACAPSVADFGRAGGGRKHADAAYAKAMNSALPLAPSCPHRPLVSLVGRRAPPGGLVAAAILADSEIYHPSDISKHNQ